MRGLAAILVPLAVFGKGRELAITVFDRFEIRIGGVDHVLARRASEPGGIVLGQRGEILIAEWDHAGAVAMLPDCEYAAWKRKEQRSCDDTGLQQGCISGH